MKGYFKCVSFCQFFRLQRKTSSDELTDEWRIDRLMDRPIEIQTYSNKNLCQRGQGALSSTDLSIERAPPYEILNLQILFPIPITNVMLFCKL